MQSANEQNSEMGSPSSPQKAPKERQSVGMRWLTALVLMPVVLLFALLGGWWSFAAVVVVMGLCAFEWHAMMVHAGHQPLLWLNLALNVLFLVAAMLPDWYGTILKFGLGGALFLSFALLFRRKSFEGVIVDWAMTLAGSIYIGWSLSYILLVRGYESALHFSASGIAFSLPRGLSWLLVILLGVWGFDSAAFFAGRHLGRYKLAPRISPAKTWEGLLGGFVLSIIAALVLTVVPLGVPWYLAILLGALVGIAATLGDLAESFLKRQTNVKDSGQVMPGHGGMLDRVDSLMFVAIVVYMFMQLFGQ